MSHFLLLLFFFIHTEVFLSLEVSLELSDTFAASEQLENGRQDPIRVIMVPSQEGALNIHCTFFWKYSTVQILVLRLIDTVCQPIILSDQWEIAKD